eukprot:5983580-Prymnesium_polylepis.1
MTHCPERYSPKRVSANLAFCTTPILGPGGARRKLVAHTAAARPSQRVLRLRFSHARAQAAVGTSHAALGRLPCRLLGRLLGGSAQATLRG